MQFKVPQFLDIEDKIFGPFTFREFIYLAGGAGLCFIIYKFLGIIWGGVPIILVGGFSLALAFYRPNNKPFINMVEASLKYVVQDKLYIWQRRKVLKEDKQESKKAGEIVLANRGPRLSGSKLKDLAWSLDVLDLGKHQGQS